MPERVGRYEVVELVGRGGMGAVYRVRDTLFRRSLALKILGAEFLHDRDLRGRFLEESQLMGQLQHPGIPPVHDFGEVPDARPYFTMKLIRGETLAQLLGKRTGVEQDRPRFLGIFEQVCATLAYAHSQGVIHRDLKPANVMVGAFGEVQVMDWGLGKVRATPEANPARGSVICTARSETPEAATLAGATMGTPAYMAPEQARGEVDGLDERCDVFGLGAILCEILTGEPAFLGWDVADVLRQARRGDIGPALARLAKSGADADLVRLATRCLAEDRRGRPASAEEVHREVVGYLNGVQERLRQAELAKKEADVRAAEKRERRRTVYRLGSVIAALLLALAAGGGWIRHVRGERERQRSMVRQGLEARFDEADRALAAGKAQEAKGHLDTIRAHLADAGDPDFEGRLAGREEDLALLGELDTLFGRRWQVMQQVVLEQVHSGKRGKGLAMGQPRLDSATYTRGVTREEISAQYAAAFRKRGLDPTRSSAEEVIGHVEGSVIRKSLIDALDQWLLLEPGSRALLEVLNALDETRSAARRILADGESGKQIRGDMAELEKGDPDPGVVMYLSELLPDDRAVALLKRTVRRVPDDYGLLTVLAYRLLLMRPARADRAEEATGYALAAYALKPNNSFACLMVAIAMKAAGKLDEAIGQGHRAVDLDGKNAAALNHLGMAYTKKNQRDQAIECWKRAVGADPKHHSAYCNLGWAYREKAEYAEAIKWLHKAVALDSRCATAQQNLGRAYRQKGEYDAAVACFRKVIELEPEQAAGYNNMGWAYNGKGEYDEAIKWLRKAIAIDPKYAKPHTNMGVAYRKKKENAQALEWFRKAIAIDPKDALAHTNMGEMYYARGQYLEAVASYEKAIDFEPKKAKAYNDLGRAYRMSGRYDEALEAFEKAIGIDPKYVAGYSNIGWTYNAKKEYDKAITRLLEGVKIDPRYALLYNNIGEACNGKKEYARAIEWFDKAIAASPNLAVAYNNKGFSYYSLSRYDEAARCYEKAAALEPKNQYAHYNSGLAYKEKKDYDAALSWFRKLLVIAPSHVEGHFYSGWICAEKGRHDEAIEWYRKTISLEPKHLNAHIHLVLIFYKKGRYEEAIEWSRKAVVLDPKSLRPHYGLLISLAGAKRFEEAAAAVDAARRVVAKSDWLDLCYNAACVYSLASSAPGDPTRITPAERHRLRKQALTWLREERAEWAALAKKTDRTSLEAAARKLRQVLDDADFKGVRDGKALESFDAEERKEWQEFWKAIRADLAGLETSTAKGR